MDQILGRSTSERLDDMSLKAWLAPFTTFMPIGQPVRRHVVGTGGIYSKYIYIYQPKPKPSEWLEGKANVSDFDAPKLNAVHPP